jgi:signal peptidase I
VSDGTNPGEAPAGSLNARIAARAAERRLRSSRHSERRAAASHAASGRAAPSHQRGRRHAKKASTPSLSRRLVRYAGLIGFAVLLTFLLRTFVVQPFWIPSSSMEPTLHGCTGCNEDRLLVDKLSYKFHSVHRGDVVVFSRPPNFNVSEDDLIKRVIGLPGETVSGHDGKVWIGNTALKESYVKASCGGTADFTPVLVPKGDVFVMGDNRCDSSDSRVFGPIEQSSIVGRAFVVLWPLGRIHLL